MRGINRVTLVGRIGADPETRTSASGTNWSTLSVATDRRKKDGGQWVDHTDWHRVKVFGDNAERCQKFLVRGSLVGVEGSVAYDSWTTEDGTRRFTTNILADRVHFLDARREQVAPEVAPIDL